MTKFKILKPIITLILNFSIMASIQAQTNVNLSDQCNCEVMTSATEVSTGATTPAATETGTLLVDASGDIFYWDGDSWEQATSQNQGPWFDQATGDPADANTEDIYQMGNVGIGTDSPSTDLDVDGGVRFRSLADGSTKDSIVTIGADGNLSKLSVGDLFTNSFIEEPFTDILYAGFSHENGSITVSSTINGAASTYTNLVNSTDDGGGALTFNSGTNSVYSQHATATDTIDATGEEIIVTVSTFASYSTVLFGLSTDPNGLGTDAPYQFRITRGGSSGTKSVYINGEQKYTAGGWTGAYKITRTENGLNFYINDVLVYCHINGSTTEENISSQGPWFNTETNSAVTANTDSVYIMGKVGVGIDSPEAMLHINGSNEEIMRLGDGALDNKWLTFRNDWGGAQLGLHSEVIQGSTPPATSHANGYALIKAGLQKGFAISTDNSEEFSDVDSTDIDFFITRSGDVGIGTYDPKELLHVEGKSYFSDTITTGYSLNFGGAGSAGGFIQHGWDLSGDGNGDELKLQPNVNPSAFSKITFYTNRYGTVAERMRISDTGNVGIGTNNPSEKLEVDGNIAASGNFISSGTTLSVPDYVFETYFEGTSELKEDYEFASLSEVEAFVKENKHLPGIKSAKEVKESDIYNLTAASLNHLEKIEELFLHVINQQKQIEALKSENESLNAQLSELEDLKAEVATIKSMLTPAISSDNVEKD